MDIRHYLDGGMIIDAKIEEIRWFLNHPSEMIADLVMVLTFF